MGVLLQHSSGYGGLDNTPLARPGYYNEIMNVVYERDFLPEITNNQINERITACTNMVQILKAPEVTDWRTYQINQEMVPGQITANSICLYIDQAAYQSIKIDKLTIRWACERWSQWEAKFLEATYEKYVFMQREWVLTAMLIEADPRNKGNRAGAYKDINLGARGNPVVINKDNLLVQFTLIQQVLMEHLAWKENEMFIVVPVHLRSILIQSKLADASFVGSCAPCSVAIDGMWRHQIAGFNLIESIHVPNTIEDDGRLCFYMIAGNRDAFAYAADIVEGRIMENPKTFGLEYQMLAVWGGKMLYPERIAVCYGTFEI